MTGFHITSWPEASAAPPVRGGDGTPRRRISSPLLDAWRTGLVRWGAPPAATAALETVIDPGTAVVITGQQPGVWGGPLFSLYKAATAVALAARLRASGRPAAAVFWIGADDADWDEAGWGALPREDLSLFRERWTSPLPSRAWIGDARLALTPEAETLLAGLPGDVRAPGVPARGGDMDLGDGFAACLLELFGGDGLVPLDARWPEVRAAGEELWRTYLDGHAGYAAGVREQGKALAAAGRPVAIADADSDHGLFVVRDRGRAEIDPATWESEARRALAAEGPAALAPSVLLRAPLQDYLFAPHAQVVGVGEAAYLAQLTPVYEGLGIPEPARVPRLEATFLPAGMVPRDRLGEACADPEAFLTELARDRVPSELARRLGDLRLSTAAGLAELRDGGRAFAKDLDQVADSAARKIDHELSRLDDVFSRRARQGLYAEAPRLRHLAEFLRPRRGPQERGLSALSLRWWAGKQTRDALTALATRHLERLDEGTRHHFALEIDHA